MTVEELLIAIVVGAGIGVAIGMLVGWRVGMARFFRYLTKDDHR